MRSLPHSPFTFIRHWRVLACVLVACAWAACQSFTPLQGWKPEYGPVVPHDTFPAKCDLCHTGGNWKSITADFTFDHGKETGVDLLGAHANVSCLLCHNDRGPVKMYADQGCTGCHVDVHQGNLGKTCTSCHTESSWAVLEAVSRHDFTRLPLVGAHTATPCYRCHDGAPVGNFSGLDPRCSSCHLDEYLATTNPNHVTSGFGTACNNCHNTFGWRGAAFDIANHPFPITSGRHHVSCATCHVNPGNYQVFSCIGCHAHNQQEMDDQHSGEPGYQWSSPACYNCHPNGH
jgi:hypothetical protein